MYALVMIYKRILNQKACAVTHMFWKLASIDTNDAGGENICSRTNFPLSDHIHLFIINWHRTLKNNACKSSKENLVHFWSFLRNFVKNMHDASILLVRYWVIFSFYFQISKYFLLLKYLKSFSKSKQVNHTYHTSIRKQGLPSNTYQS